jgi:hypothetical protein
MMRKVIHDARESLRDPVDGSVLDTLTDDLATFQGGGQYPCVDGRPILIDEGQSLFSVREIETLAATTQSSSYRDRSSLKNYVRQRMLPSLTWDPLGVQRQANLTARVAGRPVLVIGAGDRAAEYRARFPSSLVVCSDVHFQFDADCVIDAHRIPFSDRTFGLVLAAQVLEHTSRPWVVSREMQRVTQLGGLIHIEVPFEFPYHGAPYDFYRFTPSALRFLFESSELIDLDVTEGRFSAAAVSLAAGVTDTFENRYARQAAVAFSRFAFGWMKYLDAFGSRHDRFNSPKGVYVTVAVDGTARTEGVMLAEVRDRLGLR